MTLRIYSNTVAGACNLGLAMIRDQQIPANTPRHLLLDKLSTTVAMLSHVGILARGNILRIWAELSVGLNPDELECERNEGAHTRLWSAARKPSQFTMTSTSLNSKHSSCIHYSTGWIISVIAWCPTLLSNVITWLLQCNSNFLIYLSCSKYPVNSYNGKALCRIPGLPGRQR